MIGDSFESVVDRAKALGHGGYWYLASPYTKYPRGTDLAFVEISAITGRLLKAGVPIFCPIAHSHPIAIYGELDRLDHTVWLPLDEHQMHNAIGCIVATMNTWETSYGVAQELKHFNGRGAPILYLDVRGLT